jgi:hypothetical protein
MIKKLRNQPYAPEVGASPPNGSKVVEIINRLILVDTFTLFYLYLYFLVNAPKIRIFF